MSAAADRPATGRRRRRAPSRSTPERLLAAAERLFGERGVEGTSLRRVAALAGVNSAAVHYHFGSRDALVEAVVLRRVEGIQRRRQEMLRDLADTGRSGEVRRLVEVLILPWAEVATRDGESGRAYIRLVAGLYVDQRALVSGLVMSHFGESYREIGELVARALPKLPESLLHRRLALLVHLALHSLAEPEAFVPHELDAESPSEGQRLAELVDFLVGGLCGPPAR